MTGKVKIARDSVNIKKTSHTASCASFKIFTYPSFLLLSVVGLYKLNSGWNVKLFYSVADVDLVHFENILNI